MKSVIRATNRDGESYVAGFKIDSRREAEIWRKYFTLQTVDQAFLTSERRQQNLA
jgi:hypothetical protein